MQLFSKLLKKKEFDESLYDMQLGHQRLVKLSEILAIYKKQRVRLKPFSQNEGETTMMPPQPNIDVIYETEHMKQQPSMAQILDKGEKAYAK